MAIEHHDRSPSDSATLSLSTTSASMSRPAPSPRCSGRAGAASRRCCAIIAGLELPDSGRSQIDGEDMTRRAGTRPRDRLLLPALRAVPPHDGPANVAFGLEVRQPAQGRDPKARSTSCSSWSASTGWPSATRRSCPVASASGWRSPGRSPSSPRCSSWTSRSAPSTPRCARSCGPGCAGCTRRSQVTTVLVTHDQEEAMEVADRLAVDQPRPARAGRHAAGDLRPPGQRVRPDVPRARHPTRRRMGAPPRPGDPPRRRNRG